MNLRRILLRYFLPFVLLFMTLSIISMASGAQKVYYPAFEKLTISALNGGLTDVFFKPKPKGASTDFNYNNVAVLFQSKKILTKITEEAKQRNVQGKYKYSGFNIAVDETFVAPLIFFVCLLIFTPGSIKKKGLSLILGTLLILSFSYLIVYFKGLYMVGKSGIRSLVLTQNDISFYKLMHFFFSPVTIVTVVLITWILVSFRKSDLNRFFP